MMATRKDLDKDQEAKENQEEKNKLANLCFMADIAFDVETSEPQLSYNEMSNAYDELLNDS